MHNLKTVISFEFIRTIKKKSFWISIIAIPVLIGVVGGISYLSNVQATSSRDEAQKEISNIGILDESGLIGETSNESFTITPLSDQEEGIAQVKNGTLDEFIYYPKDPTTEPILVYGQDDGLFNSGKYGAVATEILKESSLEAIASPEKRAIVEHPEKIQTSITTYDNGVEAKGIESVIAPAAFLGLFFLIIILMGNEMLSSTTEEKENRVIEMILTTVTSRTLLFGKIISLVLLALVRIAVILIPLVLWFLYSGSGGVATGLVSNIDLTAAPIIVAAAIFVISFLLFTGLLVTVGAIMPTAKEAARFFGLVMFSIFVPFYAVQAIVSDPSQMIVKIFSFFPTTAPVTLLLRNAVGNLAPWELGLGFGILLFCTIVVLFSAERAFRYGALEYSRRLDLKTIFRKS